MTRTSHVQSTIVQMATRTGLAVQRRFRSRGFVADLDDVYQEAALHAIETMQRKRLDPTRNPAGYLYRTGARRAALAASRALAVVSITKGVAERGGAAKLQGRVRLDKRSVELAHCAAPEETSRARLEAARRHAAARIALRSALERHVARFEGRERRALQICLGWEGDAIDVAGTAWLVGITIAELVGLVRQLGNSVRRDVRARAARAVIRETTED